MCWHLAVLCVAGCALFGTGEGMHRLRPIKPLVRSSLLIVGMGVGLWEIFGTGLGIAAAKLKTWHKWPDLEVDWYPSHLAQPRLAGSAMVTTADGSVWLYGGYYEGGGGNPFAAATLSKLDATTKRWTTIPPKGSSPKERVHPAMAAVGNSIYLHGGFDL